MTDAVRGRRRPRTGLDAVHANAGAGEFKPLAEVSAADVDTTFGTNVRGTTLTVQGAPAVS